MNAPKLKSQPLYFQVILIGGFIFISFMLLALGRSIYRDLFQIGKYVQTSVLAIEDQKEVLAEKPSELAYAQSPHFQEKIAKELLGKKLPGEEVIVISNEAQNFEDLFPSKKKTDDSLALLTTQQRWLRYLFGI
ncbi:MAG: hypothetical protein PHO48_01285 [Candidatus Gracilibacteria bacterium]|nr:hypothetical protein [Candidatus Gracilibacteria bacterium]MDD5178790.1 hypothetical protein [Candidatus Gracilibacteria bacterium]